MKITAGRPARTRRALRRLWSGGAVAACALLLIGFGDSEPRGRAMWNGGFRMCPVAGGAPVVDGNVAADGGWNQSWRFYHGSGTVLNNVVMHSVRTATDLYLAFEVANDASYDLRDIITIAIDSAGAKQRRLIIHPLDIAGNIQNLVKYSEKTSGGTWSVPSTTLPSGVTVDIGTTKSGAAPNVAWTVELRLNRTGFGIGGAADAGFYANVIRVNSPVPPATVGTETEFAWPSEPTPAVWVNGNEEGTPAETVWGTLAMGGSACTGVYLGGYGAITTNQLIPTMISVTDTNVFNVTAHNSSGATARQVRVTFRLANFGMPALSDWTPIPSEPPAPNPTPYQDITGTSQLFSMKWRLDATEQANYAGKGQCIAAELDARPLGGQTATLTNRWTFTNMMFGTTSSPFTHEAEISARGARPVRGRARQQFDLWTSIQVDSGEKSSFPVRDNRGAERAAAHAPFGRILFTVHGCRRSGEFITLVGQQFERCEFRTSYAYVITHRGRVPVRAWTARLAAEGLIPSREHEGRFALEVPQNGVARVRTTATPQEGRLVPIDPRDRRPEPIDPRNRRPEPIDPRVRRPTRVEPGAGGGEAARSRREEGPKEGTSGHLEA